MDEDVEAMKSEIGRSTVMQEIKISQEQEEEFRIKLFSIIKNGNSFFDITKTIIKSRDEKFKEWCFFISMGAFARGLLKDMKKGE